MKITLELEVGPETALVKIALEQIVESLKEKSGTTPAMYVSIADRLMTKIDDKTALSMVEE